MALKKILMHHEKEGVGVPLNSSQPLSLRHFSGSFPLLQFGRSNS